MLKKKKKEESTTQIKYICKEYIIPPPKIYYMHRLFRVLFCSKKKHEFTFIYEENLKFENKKRKEKNNIRNLLVMLYSNLKYFLTKVCIFELFRNLRLRNISYIEKEKFVLSTV